MKSIETLILALLLLWGSRNCFAQFECDISENGRLTSYHGNISHGGVFTPKGDLRVLAVFVSYGEPYDSYEVKDWVILDAENDVFLEDGFEVKLGGRLEIR